jgi:hypothetical protein
MSTLCHDFKTPRADASKRLPAIYALIPVLFYVIVVGGSYLCAASYVNYRNAMQQRDDWHQYQSQQEDEKLTLETQTAVVAQEKWKAEKLAQWIEGTRALQPIGVAVARAMPPEISLTELNLERSTELPQQILLSVRITNGSPEEVAKIQAAVGSLSYRSYNSQQLKSGESLEFRSMLAWQGQ